MENWSREDTGTEAEYPEPWLSSGCAYRIPTPPSGSPGHLSIPESWPRCGGCISPSLSPSRVLLVLLLAQGSLQSRGHSNRRGDAGALGTPLPATGPHLCEAGLARGRAPARGSQAAAVTHALTREECRRQGCPVVTSPPHRRR